MGPIVESTLVQDLAPPGPARPPAWVRPGRVAWSWWSEQDSPRRLERMKEFVDFAAEMGWEYFLVDANWNYVDEPAMLDLFRHARRRGVGVLLWYNSGGPHNEVTEAPRDRMMPRDTRRREMAWLRELGVQGLKVDFFQSDKPHVVQQYLDILHDAMEFRLMINFHGCTVPRGWERTYPHLLSMEAVRRAECYIFDAAYPSRAPEHHAILPYTRNVVGPMDYTPVTFSDNRHPRQTTSAHELPLSVVFESGWVHFADSPEGYRAQPPAVVEFLRRVPVAWDDTRWIDGEPGGGSCSLGATARSGTLRDYKPANRRARWSCRSRFLARVQRGDGVNRALRPWCHLNCWAETLRSGGASWAMATCPERSAFAKARQPRATNWRFAWDRAVALWFTFSPCSRGDQRRPWPRPSGLDRQTRPAG